MKKLLASVACFGVLATGAYAEEAVSVEGKFINFEFASVAYGTAGTDATVAGTSFTLSFNLDDKIKVGVVQENLGLTLTSQGVSATGAMTVSAINLDYTMMDHLSTGVNIGSATVPTAITATGVNTVPQIATIAASSTALSDIYVKGAYAVGKRGEINLSLAYRMVSIGDTAAVTATDGAAFDNLNGVVAKVGFSVGF